MQVLAKCFRAVADRLVPLARDEDVVQDRADPARKPREPELTPSKCLSHIGRVCVLGHSPRSLPKLILVIRCVANAALLAVVQALGCAPLTCLHMLHGHGRFEVRDAVRSGCVAFNRVLARTCIAFL